MPADEGDHRSGLVVVLDGPTGVGVSTTLAALQRAWPAVRSGPLLDVGLDHARRSFGPELDRWADLLESPQPSRDAAGHWGPLGRELVRTLPKVAALWAQAGWDVGLDLVLRDRATTSELSEALVGRAPLHIGLTCDPDVLEDRARGDGADGDRRAQKALAELGIFPRVGQRHLVLDTTEMTTDELVTEILSAVAARRGD